MSTESRKRNRGTVTTFTIILASLAVALCICTMCVVGGAAFLTVRSNSRSLPQFAPTVTPAATPWATATRGSIPSEAQETLQAMKSSDIPEADLHELGIRFLGVSKDTPRVASTVNPDYPIGTVRTFLVSNLDADQTFEVQAELVYKTAHVYMWVDQQASVKLEDIQEAADLFENHTYPTTRAFFGSEWSPGVDGDPHLSILHAENLGSTVAGYFSSADSYVQEVREDSNEMEMFYIHVGSGIEIGDAFYNGVLAHEFQHMIHWNNDRNEATWLNEGCSELSMELNNRMYPEGRGFYEVGGSEYAYLNNPDTQLNTWPEVGATGSASPHYGGSYLFLSYFLDRFGEDATQALVNHDLNGMESVDAVLQNDLGLSIQHTDVYADWVAANLLDDSSSAQGQYVYPSIDVADPSITEEYGGWGGAPYPTGKRGTVRQYGVDYIKVNSKSPLKFEFVGSALVPLMNTEPYSGKYIWWSNRADESDTRLTRVVDLPSADSIELDFWTWYHIEEDWDYAYVVVGTTKSGEIPEDISSDMIQWHILNDETLTCTQADPNNGNLGCGLTGQSSEWQNLNADLSAYAAQEVAIRFEYVTDAAVNQAGWALDDIRLVIDGEVSFLEDAEKKDHGWINEGFVRHANILPQEWIVQLIWDDSSPEVERLVFLDESAGDWTIPFDRKRDEVIIAISAIAPTTTELGNYTYSFEVTD